jgi:hypothetical protein
MESLLFDEDEDDKAYFRKRGQSSFKSF